MRDTLKLLKNDVERKRTEKKDLNKVIKESEELNIELAETNKLAMKKKDDQLTLTQKENENLRKDLGEQQTEFEILNHRSQEQEQELQKYVGIEEKKGRCANYHICGGKGNIFLGARIHRVASRCPFSKDHEVHNL